MLQVPPLESVQILAVVRLLSVEAQPPARELAPVLESVQVQEPVREQPPAQALEPMQPRMQLLHVRPFPPSTDGRVSS